MPYLEQNLKNYFEVLQISANESSFHDLNKKVNIKDTEINALFTDASVNEAMEYVNQEFHSIQNLKKEKLKRTVKQQVRSLEMIILLYQLHGHHVEELKAIKFYRSLCKLSLDMEEHNYSYAMEAFWHLIHDTKSCIPEISVTLCKQIVINKNNREINKLSIMNDLAKIIFESVDPDFPKLFNKIKNIKAQNRTFFDKNTLDSFFLRSYLSYCENILKTKALSMGVYCENFNSIESGLIMKKVALKSIDYLRNKYSDLKLYSGSFETLLYLWSFINHLLIGYQTVAEYFTLVGIGKESRYYQYDFFCYSVRYCVPYRTKMAVRLLMHSDFVYLRLPELAIRNAQLDHMKNGVKTQSIEAQPVYSNKGDIDHEIAGYNYPIVIKEKEYMNTPILKTGKQNKRSKPSSLYLSNNINGEEVVFEECFLSRSSFKLGLLAVLRVVKSYIWQIEPISEEFSVDNEWETIFIEPQDDEDSLSEEFLGLDLATPTNSPQRSTSPDRNFMVDIMNAPVRVKRIVINKPMFLEKSNFISNKSKDSDNNDGTPIESFQTVFLPNRTRNIKYEDFELPRSVLDGRNKSSVAVKKSPTRRNSSAPSLIEYLEEHCAKFRYLNVPVVHRPIYQRIALHYLLTDQLKASYYLSMAISINFRQMYLMECLMKNEGPKSMNTVRWKNTYDVVIKSIQSEHSMKSSLETFMPVGWTVLQFTMIDEIPIGYIKSSLLSAADGGCLGARNCSVLLVTKYQKKIQGTETVITVETRVMHGFRRTGLQLIAQLESLKEESAKSLQITDRKDWWSKRFSIDSSLKSLIDQMRNDWFTDENIKWMMDENTRLESEPKILILDRNISQLPVENILIRQSSNSPKCITRMPNLSALIGHLHQTRYRRVTNPDSMIARLNLEIDPIKTYFVVNPDNSLQETEDAVLPLFKKKLNWDGVTGKSGTNLDALNVLSSKDMLIYCGHGSGGKYLMDRSVKSMTSSTSLFLIGCQSARFIVEGRTEAFGIIYYYLSIGCPAVLGLLWDVTDREIDKFTVTMLTNWLGKVENHTLQSDNYLPVAPMPSYVFDKNVTQHVQLKHLTGNAAIVCGLPIWIDNTIDLSKWNL